MNGHAAEPAPVVVFGLDEKGRHHASRFGAHDADSARRAAALMGMHIADAETPQRRALMAKLPVGRIFGSGKAFVPFVKAGLYESLAAAAGVPVVALQAQNAVSPAGIVGTGGEKILVRVTGAFQSEKDILAVNFLSNGRLIRLSDIATLVRRPVDPPQLIVRVDGKDAIVLTISMREGGKVLDLGHQIEREMDAVAADLTATARADPTACHSTKTHPAPRTPNQPGA